MKRRAGITLILLGIVLLVIICSLPFFPHEQKVYEAAEIVLLDTDTQDILHTGFARFDGTATYTWGGKLTTYRGALSIDGLPLTMDPAYRLSPIHFLNGGFARVFYEGASPEDCPALGTMKYDKRLTRFSIRLDDVTHSVAGNRYVVAVPQDCTYAEAVVQNDLIIWGEPGNQAHRDD